MERDRDRYRRLAGPDGWALDYARYSGGAHAGQQQQARSERRGMWQGAFEAPWKWRRR